MTQAGAVRQHQSMLKAGIAAGILFTTVTFVEIFVRPGFDITRHAVSSLSLGERGWVMIATFLVSGILVLACAIGMRRAIGGTPSGTVGPLLIGTYGLGLVIAGIFSAPAGMGFPPGTPEDMQPVMDTEAILHSVAFMLAFSSLIIACFVFARRFLVTGERGLAAFSAATGVALPTLIGVGMSLIIAPGIGFYIAAVLAWVWLGIVASRLMR